MPPLSMKAKDRKYIAGPDERNLSGNPFLRPLSDTCYSKSMNPRDPKFVLSSFWSAILGFKKNPTSKNGLVCSQLILKKSSIPVLFCHSERGKSSKKLLYTTCFLQSVSF